MIQVIESLGDKCNRKHSKIKIIEIPEEYRDCYYINEYDGQESIQCLPSRLVEHRLKKLIPKIETLSDSDCKIILCELIQIIQNDSLDEN